MNIPNILIEPEQNAAFPRSLPPVLRARGFRLYLERGRRLVDLWQAGGAAILGHTPSAVLRELKNSAERGLYAPFPHCTERRFIKAVSRLFPGRAVRVYSSTESMRRALAATGIPVDESAVDPAVSDAGGGRLFRWRPFLPFAWPEGAVLAPVLPWPLAPAALVYAGPLSVPPSDHIPPLILSASARAVHDLIAAGPKRQEVCRLPCSGVWRQRGVYCSLAHRLSAPDYERLFLRFLDAGFLLPPDQSQPLILPTGLSSGEAAKLEAALLMRPGA
jgi:hypothetical protein